MDSMRRKGIAFDKESQRSIDGQGFMHVAGCNISRAVVNKYFGYEIPGWEAHGLIRNRVYSILRPPEELAAAAATFNNLPLVDGHIPVDAWDLEDDKVKSRIVGSTGTDTIFEPPFLKNTLVVWTSGAQKNIENRTKMELSCGYRYTFVPETGVYAGQRYDGRMTNIVGNHVALVEVGRAGHEVAVADSDPFHMEDNLKEGNVTNAGNVAVGAVHGWVRAHLAQDAAINTGEISALIATVPPGAYNEQVPLIVNAVNSAFAGRLTADADVVGGLTTILESIPSEFFVVEDADDAKKDPDEPDADDKSKVCDSCKGKLTKDGKCKPCEDKKSKKGEEPAPTPNLTGDAMSDANKQPAAITQDTINDTVTAAVKLALDEALPKQTAAVTATVAARFSAAEAVKPHVGVVDPLAADSAEAIYKLALDHNKVNLEGVDPSAYKHMVSMLPAPGTQTPAAPTFDHASTDDFDKRFPYASKVGRA